MRCSFPLLLLLLLAAGCTKNVPALKGMDMKAWRADRHGCSGQRAVNIEELSKRKDELLGLSENEVLSLLGRPDQNELYSHNQKFYHYFLEPSGECTGGSKDAKQLIVRFSAVGIASEVAID